METQEEVKKININEIVTKIKNGKSRKEIKEEYNLSPKDYKAMINHPKIKGMRTGYKSIIEWVDEDVEVDFGSNKDPKVHL